MVDFDKCGNWKQPCTPHFSLFKIAVIGFPRMKTLFPNFLSHAKGRVQDFWSWSLYTIELHIAELILCLFNTYFPLFVPLVVVPCELQCGGLKSDTLHVFWTATYSSVLFIVILGFSSCSSVWFILTLCCPLLQRSWSALLCASACATPLCTCFPHLCTCYTSDPHLPDPFTTLSS